LESNSSCALYANCNESVFDYKKVGLVEITVMGNHHSNQSTGFKV